MSRGKMRHIQLVSLFPEITEQPKRIQKLLSTQRKNVEHVAAEIQKRGYRVCAVAARGKVFNSMLEMLKRLHSDISAELIVISNDKRALLLAPVPLKIPAETPEWLSPLVAILPAQLLAYHLTIAKG